VPTNNGQETINLNSRENKAKKKKIIPTKKVSRHLLKKKSSMHSKTEKFKKVKKKKMREVIF